MRRIGFLALAGSALAAASLPLVGPPSRIGAGTRSYNTRRGIPAGINRHTGQPHEHKRAIARRLRQLAKQEGN